MLVKESILKTADTLTHLHLKTTSLKNAMSAFRTTNHTAGLTHSESWYLRGVGLVTFPYRRTNNARATINSRSFHLHNSLDQRICASVLCAQYVQCEFRSGFKIFHHLTNGMVSFRIYMSIRTGRQLHHQHRQRRIVLYSTSHLFCIRLCVHLTDAVRSV